MENVVGFLGWVGATGLLGALSSYFLKLIGRTLLKGVSREHARFLGAYRTFMKFMIQNHRFFAFGALGVILVHAGLVILGSAISLTGAATAMAMVLTASLGAYGHYFRKSMRAGWLSFHRAFAFLAVFAAGVHFFFKAYVAL